jgi:hypothetical protein
MREREGRILAIQFLICDDEERFFYYDKKRDIHILLPISRLLPIYISSFYH